MTTSMHAAVASRKFREQQSELAGASETNENNDEEFDSLEKDKVMINEQR